MSKKLNAQDLPEFDAAKYLRSEQDVVEYLTVVIVRRRSSPVGGGTGRYRARQGHDRNCEGIGPDARGALQGTAAQRTAPIRHHRASVRGAWRAAGGATHRRLIQARVARVLMGKVQVHGDNFKGMGQRFAAAWRRSESGVQGVASSNPAVPTI